MNTSTVTTGSPAQQPRALSYTRPEPSILTVGVVVFQWNDCIRQRVQKLGSELGRSGIRMQLLTYTDIRLFDKKADSLDGVVFQIMADTDAAEKRRFDAILQSHQQQIFGSRTVIAAFSSGEMSSSDMEAGIDLSMKAHVQRCEWLGLADTQPNDKQFQQWCRGIALRVRQTAKGASVLAA
ncbi:MAG: hypothetical protein HWE26_02520 [Alteromonadaceae bacterium]|nr:hypothetical protein [Alteromonadaceae bacterium]